MKHEDLCIGCKHSNSFEECNLFTYMIQNYDMCVECEYDYKINNEPSNYEDK